MGYKMKFNSIYIEKQNKNRKVYKLINNEDESKLKDINKEIVNKHHLRIANRNAIIKTLIQFLSQGTIFNNNINLELTKENFFIVKTDIADFFPSVNKHKLYKKIVKASILNDSSIEIIKSFIFNNRYSGIPLGTTFSNSLAEVYLEEFDKNIRRHINPLLFCRYVDDIVLVIPMQPSENNAQIQHQINKIIEYIEKQLGKYDLELNQSKTSSYKFIYKKNDNKNDNNFDFLGYNFRTENNKLYIDISEDKYKKKILNKLIRSFKLYKTSKHMNNDFWILYYRLKNIIYGVSSNGKNGNLKFGISYTYKFINSDVVLRKFIKSYHYFVYQNRQYLNSTQRNLLYSLICVNKNNNKYILNGKSDSELILLILDKRTNYNKMSIRSLEKICKQIGSKEIIKIEDNLYKINLQVQIMKKLSFKN